MAASALQWSMRRAFRWAVIAVVVGVIALYHIAAHHGAADTDHVAGAGASLETGHDAEPAAGVQNLDLSGLVDIDRLVAQDRRTYARSEPKDHRVGCRSSDDGGAILRRFSAHATTELLAVLTALRLLAAAVALFLSRRSHRVHGSHPAWQRCARRGRAPPLRAPSVPSPPLLAASPRRLEDSRPRAGNTRGDAWPAITPYATVLGPFKRQG